MYMRTYIQVWGPSWSDKLFDILDLNKQFHKSFNPYTHQLSKYMSLKTHFSMREAHPNLIFLILYSLQDTNIVTSGVTIYI